MFMVQWELGGEGDDDLCMVLEANGPVATGGWRPHKIVQFYISKNPRKNLL